MWKRLMDEYTRTLESNLWEFEEISFEIEQLCLIYNEILLEKEKSLGRIF